VRVYKTRRSACGGVGHGASVKTPGRRLAFVRHEQASRVREDCRPHRLHSREIERKYSINWPAVESGGTRRST